MSLNAWLGGVPTVVASRLAVTACRRRFWRRLHPGGSGGSVASSQLPHEETPRLSAHLSAAQTKARLDHPIIDADGHWIEYGPVFTEELHRVGGEDAVQGWNAVRNGTHSALNNGTGRS
jgi:hypothetical protein